MNLTKAFSLFTGSSKAPIASGNRPTVIFSKRIALWDLKADPTEVDRTILLLGSRGHGKSALGNVITGVHNDEVLIPVFTEAPMFVVRETEQVQECIVDSDDGMRYRVVDTVGMDSPLGFYRGKMMELAKACGYLQDGISQILFVTSGETSSAQLDAFHFVQNVLFQVDVSRHITIVRTRTPFFQDPAQCKRDVEALQCQNKQVWSMYDCINKVIHVNNPGHVGAPDPYWRQQREQSRLHLLAHLGTCTGLYKPDSVEVIEERIDEYIATTTPGFSQQSITAPQPPEQKRYVFIGPSIPDKHTKVPEKAVTRYGALPFTGPRARES